MANVVFVVGYQKENIPLPKYGPKDGITLQELLRYARTKTGTTNNIFLERKESGAWIRIDDEFLAKGEVRAVDTGVR